jgi:adenylylsulfate kinase-like enzyme
MARRLMEQGRFFEVFVEMPLAVAETLTHGTLQEGAGAVKPKSSTGVHSADEVPENPETLNRHRRADARAGGGSHARPRSRCWGHRIVMVDTG